MREFLLLVIIPPYCFSNSYPTLLLIFFVLRLKQASGAA